MPETQRHSKKVRRGDRFFFSRAKISLKKKSVHFAGSLEPLIREGRPQNGNSGRSGARFRVLGRFWGPGRETAKEGRSVLRGPIWPLRPPPTGRTRRRDLSVWRGQISAAACREGRFWALVATWRPGGEIFAGSSQVDYFCGLGCRKSSA